MRLPPPRAQFANCIWLPRILAKARGLAANTLPSRISEWNHVAVNLGRPGFPLADRLPIALATAYKHIDPIGKTTVFEVLEADEKEN
jgi:hypothetical protein